MRRTLVITAIGLIVLTAGCSALTPGDDGPDASPTEATEAPTETDARTADSTAAAAEQAWIEDGELDADALEATHVDAVMDAGSFQISSEIATTHGGEEPPTPWFENQTLETGWNLERERQVLDNEFQDSPERLTLYVDDGDVYVREQVGDRTRYAVDSDDRTAEQFREEMRNEAHTGTGALSEWTFDFEGAQQCGDRTCYRFSGSDFDGDREVPETVTDGEATLVVDKRGIVRELTQEFEGETDGQAATVVVTSEYRDVGESTLPEPEWIEEAREETETGE